MGENTTIIDLDKLENNAALSKNELIYKDECDRLCDTIRRKVQNNVEAARLTPGELACQPCFFINGGRGSGKTTLLRAVRKELASRNSKQDVGIVELAAIDPTELAETENFFIHVLGRIQKVLRDIQSKSSSTDEEKAHIRNARMSIDKMSKGLGLLVRRPEDGGSSSDSEFFVQQSVEDCVSGVELKREFASLVEIMCKLRNVDALLVTVDDADMNFNKCSEVFETVRKYLINARMVFVFAGDLKLYTMVVRGMQMQHFGDLLLRYDSERREHRFNLLDILEDQYVMKLFPVENRASLSDFSGVLHRKINIKDSEGKRIELEKFLREQLASKVKEHLYPVVSEFLRRLTTRSALQLISYWVKNIKVNTAHSLSAVWAEGIRQIAMQALIKHKVDSQGVHHEGLPALIPAVIRHAQSLNQGVGGASLSADMGDDSQKMVSFFLSAEAMRFVQTPASVLQYVLRVFPALESSSEEMSIEQHLHSESSRQWGAVCTARMMSKMNLLESEGKLFANGVIPLLSLPWEVGYESPFRISVQDFVGRFTETAQSLRDEEETCAVLAICHSFSHVVEQGRGTYCLSVFNLLNTVSRLMAIKKAPKAALCESINDILLSATTIPVVSRQVSSSSAVKRRSRDTSDVQLLRGGEPCDFKELRFSPVRRGIDSMVNKIYQWITIMNNEKVVVPPYELRNVWSSFILSSQLVTNSAKMEALDARNLVQAGELFKAYLNAFLEYGDMSESSHMQKVMKSIAACPLCEWWLNATDESSTVFNHCNQINIGPVQLNMGKETAENFILMKLKTATEAIRHQGLRYFENIVNGYIWKLTEVYDKASIQAQMKCESTVIPLYEKLVGLRQKKGKRKGPLGKREKNVYASRIVSSLKNELILKHEKNQFDFKDMCHKTQKEYENNLDLDIEERTNSICQKLVGVSNEGELSDLIKNNMKGSESEHGMLMSSKGNGLVKACNDCMNAISVNVEKLINERIADRRDALIRQIRDLEE